ncbi:unnamed protein product [Hapterophycus canaliculatus]
MAERAGATPLDYKKTVTRALCWAVKEPTLEALEDHAARHGLRVVQAWKAPRGEGFKAAAARFVFDGDEVLVVAFRATFGNDEWLEYPQKFWKQRFMPHDGEAPDTNLKVFSVWSVTLDEIWKAPGDMQGGARDILRSLIWRQLNAGNRVWLTGHSKGGAVATTAASRLLLGDSWVGGKEERADPAVRRPEPDALNLAGGPLSRLSVFTHNAPMAFSAPLAELYDARWAEVGKGRRTGEGDRGAARYLRGGGGGEEEGEGPQHMRFEHRSDRVRKLPPSMDMRHVGDRELEGTGLVEDGGVIAGSAIAVVGVVAAMLAAAAKVVNSH